MSARARTRQAGPTSRVIPALASILALMLCAAGLAAILHGSLKVKNVEVVGQGLPAAYIVASSGLPGQNIFTIRSDEVVARLARVPEIVVRRVETALPDRVIIYARERIPMVAWRSGTALYLMDPEGRIIDRVPRTNLPVIVGAGQNGTLGPGIVEAVRYAVTMMPHAIAAFRFRPSTGLTIVGSADWTADVGNGNPQTLVARIATLNAFLSAIRSRPGKLLYVDLRYGMPHAKFSGT